MQFKALTIKSTSGRFFELLSEIGVSPPIRDQDLDRYAQTTYWTNCLWDTGAAYSAITKEAVDALGLEAIGETTVFYGQGEANTNVYRVSLNLPNLLFLPQLKVSECATHNAFGVIIGMDVICKGDFAITNIDGVTTFSFCVPSMETIDYVQRIATMENGE